MIGIIQSATYSKWFDGLKDRQAKARVNARIRRLSEGNVGDAKALGGGVSELRIDYGPGYRVYFTRRGSLLVLLLCGGDKRTQSTDIKRAVEMAKQIE